MRDKNYFQKQNQYNRDNYDRVGLMFPKGQKEVIKSVAESQGLSLNAFIIEAVNAYLERFGYNTNTNTK